jgi:hypothetical protein
MVLVDIITRIGSGPAANLMQNAYNLACEAKWQGKPDKACLPKNMTNGRL